MAVKRKKKKAAKGKKRAKKKAGRKATAKGRKKAKKVKKTARKPAKRKKKGARKKTAKRKGAKKKKGARKKAAKKKKKGKKRKANPAFMKPLTPSSALAAVVGSAPLPRTQVVKKLWAYIKRNKLQDAKNRRMIIADAKLKPLFGGRGKVDMFKMTALVSKHLK